MNVNNLVSRSYEFRDFRLIPEEHLLLYKGESVSLSPKVFELLVCLVESEGHLIKKSALLERLWPDSFVEEATLARSISTLRKTLGETAENKFIETVPKRGYRFVAPVKELIDEENTAHSDEIEQESVPTNTPNKNLSHDLSQAKIFWQRRAVVPGLIGSVVIGLLIVAGIPFYSDYSSGQNNQGYAATIPFVNARIKQITTKGRVNNAVISPDGNFYAYTLSERGEYKNSLWLGQTDSTGDLQLRSPDDGEVIRGLAFSPDGKTLYFALTRGENPQAGLFKMPVIGGVAEKLSDGIGYWFTLSPDGKQIAFFRPSREREASAALVVTSLDSTNEREIVTRTLDKSFSTFSPAWSPDGSLIAFGAVSNPAKQSDEIYIVRVADGHTEQLAVQEWFEIANLTWRRDGHGLIISAIGKSEPKLRHLWHMDYPAGTTQRLSQDTGSYAFALSTSSNGGELLAVQLHRESNIWIAPSDDLSKARQVTFSSINGFFGWHGFDWTADGDIVFSAGVDRGLAIKTMRSDGSGVRQITSSGFFDQRPSVTRDRRYIFFRSNRNGATEIWRINADGSDLKQLTADGSNSAPHVTPDGKWVIYISAHDGRNFLSRISVEGGDRVDVADQTTSADPRVSPDGNLIAYGYKKDGRSPMQLAVVSIEGGRPIRLFDVPRTANFAQSLRWTPDGEAICYRDWVNGIWRQDLSGTPAKRLEGLPEEKFYNFGWSADGKLFAFTRGREIRDAVLMSDLR